MDYLLLVYQNQGESDSDDSKLAEACRENNLALRESGTLVVAATLQSGASNDTVSLRNGVVAVSDKGAMLTGIYLVHAKDMNDAIRTGTNMPQARLGAIEIRAVVNIEV
jgi:hypothetical protein